jgi:cell division protease FtsH
MRKIIEAAYKRSYDLVKNNQESLKRLAEALLERETLEGEEIDLIIEGKELAPMEKVPEAVESTDEKKEDSGQKEDAAGKDNPEEKPGDEEEVHLST